MSRGHNIVKKFLQQRGAWDNNPYKPTTTSATTKSTTPVTGHAFNEADVRVTQPAYNPRPGETIIGSTNGVENMNSKAQYVANGAVMQKKPQTKQVKTVSRYQGKNLDTPNTELRAQQIPVKTVTSYKGKNVGEAVVTTKTNKDASTEINRLGHQAGQGIRAGANIVDKSGAIHSPMSRARHLARLGMQQMLKLNPKIGESWNNDILDQLDEVHPAVLAMAKVGAKQALKAQADKHTEKALAANRAGDDEKVRYHQAEVAKIKAKMHKEETEQIDEGRMKDIYTSMMHHADKKGYTSHKQFTPADYDAVGKEHGISGKELAIIAGHKTAAQVTKEENLDELSINKMARYYQNAIKTPADINKLAKTKLASGGTKLDQRLKGKTLAAKKLMNKMNPNHDVQGPKNDKQSHNFKNITKPGNYHDFYTYDPDRSRNKVTLRQKHRWGPQGPLAAKHPVDHNIVNAPYGAHRGVELHHASKKTPKSKARNLYKEYAEETLDELKASTLQSYSDKAHQQALDATYDAAHLNRPGEEKYKADAKKLAAKRAAGVQRAQTKLDKMGEALEWPHSAGDVVRCKKTQRLACIQSVENDQYTVVYADGSTQTGPADYWTQIDPVNEARVVQQPRGWNVKHLKPAGHGIVGKKVRSYDFPGMHDSHYVEGHVTDEDPQSYHIRTTKVVRHHKEEPIPAHLTHIRAPKGLHIFGNAQGVYYAPKDMKPQVKKPLKNLRNKR